MPEKSNDLYRTLAAPSEGLFKDRGSRFLAYAFPVSSAEECIEKVKEIRRQHLKARHHCFAYDLGHDGDNYRMSDDGEPSGTAGKPIMGQIKHFDLRNVLVVVVRYFGGVKLGTSGLINAYRESTRDALQRAEIVQKQRSDYIEIAFGYETMPAVMQAVKAMGIDLHSKDFGDRGRIVMVLPHSGSAELLRQLKAKILGVSLEQIGEKHDIPGIVFTHQYTL